MQQEVVDFLELWNNKHNTKKEKKEKQKCKEGEGQHINAG